MEEKGEVQVEVLAHGDNKILHPFCFAPVEAFFLYLCHAH